MQKSGDEFRLSASDLVGHLNCRHLTQLDIQAAHGTLRRNYFQDPFLDTLIERGERHERGYLAHLIRQGHAVARIEGVGLTPALVRQTLEVMRAGAPVIAQAALMSGNWGGRADVLLRVETPSIFGAWSYEAVDTKLARETRAGTVLQLSLYSDLLSQAQGRAPDSMHVVTPGADYEKESFATDAFAAYYRYVKRRLVQSLGGDEAAQTYPDPAAHCEICHWRTACETRRRDDDHLCLVAGISRIQIDELQRRDVHTSAALASVPTPLPWKPERGAKQAYERVREQARVQVQGRESGSLVYETLTPVAGLGLARLPEPSAGDVFFDLEADPFVGEGGLEYLFGYVTTTVRGESAYHEHWAFTREEEKHAFEQFVDFVMARWEAHPDMHVYHYAHYEPGALKRLMGRYATREDEIDRMLRGGVFVDLYAIARQSVRASVESYSIKDLEPFYDFERSLPLADARGALAAIQGCLELDDIEAITEETRRAIGGYNRDDCLSAMELRGWLEKLRAGLIAQGIEIPRPLAASPEPTEDLNERQKRVAELVQRLAEDVPVDKTGRLPDEHARWILAYTLDWHRRELKSVYWERYRLADLPAEDLIDERCALAGLRFVAEAGGTPRAPVHRYAFLPQEVEFRGGESLLMAGTGARFGKVEAISLEARTVDIKKRKDTATVHPEAVFAHDVFDTDVMADALLRIGDHVAANGIAGVGPYQAARDLLRKEKPHLGGEPLRVPGETTVEQAVRIAPRMQGGVLAIQGPPGAGKTYTAARMICTLVQAGKTVGITANSHKVIRNLLNEVVKAADTMRFDIQCIQKSDEDQPAVHGLRFTTDNATALSSIGNPCSVAGATAWFWSRPDAFEAVDTLFVDEAAQMSLANVLAVSQACRTLVLLGDPRQLEQPMKGSHPEGTDVSALDHILGENATIGEDEGLFLNETWRLHPSICAFTSELFYGGRLRSRDGLAAQVVRSTSRVSGAGLRYLPVLHQGNQSASPEEADRIEALVAEILQSRSTWIDREGNEAPVELKDILIIAPYNAQVIELQQRLPGAHIGTVDKFQGQEAAIVIYSMTTSSHADAPRGMDFLYSLNRLNVATSRAKCVCVLVGSPALFEPECRTPWHMEMANAFCRYLELAQTI